MSELNMIKNIGWHSNFRSRSRHLLGHQKAKTESSLPVAYLHEPLESGSSTSQSHYVWEQVCVWVGVHVCARMCVCTCVHVYVCACMYVCMHVHCVRTCVHMCVHARACVRARTCVHMYACMRMHLCARVCVCVRRARK